LETLTAHELDYRDNSETEFSRLRNPAVHNVDLMADEIAVYGGVTPELWAMVADEEFTQGAEVLAVQEMAYAAVPRSFRQHGEDLIDPYNQSLKQVLHDGIDYMRQELSLGTPGADWELSRREAEFRNAETIMSMQPSMLCVEISATPFDKPKHEQLAQHYTDLTMIRLSHKDQNNKIAQYNYALPVSSPEFLRAIQIKLGRKPDEQLIGSQELLENPIIQNADQSPDQLARHFDGLIGAALLEAAVGHSAVRMINRAIENRRESWEFVTSHSQADIHYELQAAMQQAAQLPPSARAEAMDAIRSGFWKELKDRFQGKQQMAMEGGILMAAAARAVVDGDVFISCGSTVVATQFASSGESSISRAQIAESLQKEVKGSGSCSACGAKGLLYGCGFCGRCNKKWCEEYKRTGKQTNIKDLAYRNYSRPEEVEEPENLKDYLERISREIKQKHEIKKLHEAETIRLKEEQQLASFA